MNLFWVGAGLAAARRKEGRLERREIEGEMEIFEERESWEAALMAEWRFRCLRLRDGFEISDVEAADAAISESYSNKKHSRNLKRAFGDSLLSSSVPQKKEGCFFFFLNKALFGSQKKKNRCRGVSTEGFKVRGFQRRRK